MNQTALSLASSFRIASGTSSPCSFVDTRSGEGGAGVDGSHGLACLSCLPSRFWCAHNKHNAARQQNPAMHAMIMPAISPDAIVNALAVDEIQGCEFCVPLRPDASFLPARLNQCRYAVRFTSKEIAQLKIFWT